MAKKAKPVESPDPDKPIHQRECVAWEAQMDMFHGQLTKKLKEMQDQTRALEEAKTTAKEAAINGIHAARRTSPVSLPLPAVPVSAIDIRHYITMYERAQAGGGLFTKLNPKNFNMPRALVRRPAEPTLSSYASIIKFAEYTLAELEALRTKLSKPKCAVTDRDINRTLADFDVAKKAISARIVESNENYAKVISGQTTKKNALRFPTPPTRLTRTQLRETDTRHPTARAVQTTGTALKKQTRFPDTAPAARRVKWKDLPASPQQLSQPARQHRQTPAQTHRPADVVPRRPSQMDRTFLQTKPRAAVQQLNEDLRHSENPRRRPPPNPQEAAGPSEETRQHAPIADKKLGRPLEASDEQIRIRKPITDDKMVRPLEASDEQIRIREQDKLERLLAKANATLSRPLEASDAGIKEKARLVIFMGQLFALYKGIKLQDGHVVYATGDTIDLPATYFPYEALSAYKIADLLSKNEKEIFRYAKKEVVEHLQGLYHNNSLSSENQDIIRVIHRTVSNDISISNSVSQRDGMMTTIENVISSVDGMKVDDGVLVNARGEVLPVLSHEHVFDTFDIRNPEYEKSKESLNQQILGIFEKLRKDAGADTRKLHWINAFINQFAPNWFAPPIFTPQDIPPGIDMILDLAKINYFRNLLYYLNNKPPPPARRR